MRFAFILPNLVGGGAEKAVLKIASLLVERGHAAQILIIEDRIEHTLPGNLSVTVLNIEKKHSSHGWIGKHLNAYRLKNWIRKNKLEYDLLVSTLPYADEIVRLAQLPRHYCRIANTLGAEIAALNITNPTKSKRRKKRYQNLYGNYPLVTVSTGVANDLQKTLKLSSPPYIIPNPFSPSNILLLATKSSNPVHNAPYIIHVGRFSPQKRHDLLLDAWCLLPDPPDLLLLTKPDPDLIDMITTRNLQNKVRIVGFQENPYPWIEQAQLLVLCSDHEGLPNVLLEALACNTPVISTDCPSGPAEILRDMPECLVPCGDTHALANAITRSLQSPPDLTRMDFSPYLSDNIAGAWEALAHSQRH